MQLRMPPFSHILSPQVTMPLPEKESDIEEVRAWGSDHDLWHVDVLGPRHI